MRAFVRACVLVLVISPAALAEKVQSLAALKPAPGGERRMALVIGNSAYKSAPLRNPVNDARAVARALAETGFVVTLMEDASQSSMRRTIRIFGDELVRGGVGLFYYAGHGMQVRGKNFLVPVNADIEREDEVEDQAVDANLVLSKMDSARNSLNIMILDACRNNPFQRSFRTAAQGLAQMDAPSGTLIAFATAPGSVAADGAGDNGIYTKHLLSEIRQPGLPVEQLFKQVRIGVSRETGDRQIPWESSSLRGDFFFLPPVATAGAADQQAAIQKAVQDATRASDERAARERVELQQRMEQMIQQVLPKQRAIGDRWFYAGHDADRPEKKFDLLVEVLGAASSGVTEATKDSGGRSTQWVYTAEPSMVSVGAGVTMFSPLVGQPQGLQVGQTWRGINLARIGTCGLGSIDCWAEAKAVSTEKVTVQAGTFDTLRIVVSLTATSIAWHRSSARGEYTYWYSPSAKRIVKYQSRLTGNSHFLGADPNVDLALAAYQLAGQAAVGSLPAPQ